MVGKDRVTQDDPFSMFLYAIGTLPLIWSLGQPGVGFQDWPGMQMMLQHVPH